MYVIGKLFVLHFKMILDFSCKNTGAGRGAPDCGGLHAMLQMAQKVIRTCLLDCACANAVSVIPVATVSAGHTCH